MLLMPYEAMTNIRIRFVAKPGKHCADKKKYRGSVETAYGIYERMILIYYWMIPELSTVQTVSFVSLISLKPFPNSGFAEEVEVEDAFWMLPLVLTR